jgi:hypothetical protein
MEKGIYEYYSMAPDIEVLVKKIDAGCDDLVGTLNRYRAQCKHMWHKPRYINPPKVCVDFTPPPRENPVWERVCAICGVYQTTTESDPNPDPATRIPVFPGGK